MPAPRKAPRFRELRAIVCHDLFTVAELSKALGVSDTTIERLAAKGMPIVRIGGRKWINPQDTAAWLAANCHLSREYV
jgi:excisionase family DNA binding protein